MTIVKSRKMNRSIKSGCCLSPANTTIIDGKAAIELLESEDNLSICGDIRDGEYKLYT